MDREIVNKILEYIDGTKDFLLENAPSFIQEVIAYGRARAIVLMVGCPILLILGLISFFKNCKKVDFLDNNTVINVFACIGSVILCLIMFIFFLVNVETSLMSWFAPKLYILKLIQGK